MRLAGHSPRLGYVDDDATGGGVKGLGFRAVGVGASLLGACVGGGADVLLAFDEHGVVEEGGKGIGHGIGAVGDDELYEVVKDVSLARGIRVSRKVVKNLHGRV